MLAIANVANFALARAGLAEAALLAAGAISLLPLQNYGRNGDFSVEGAPPPAGNPPLAEHRIVSPGYFGAMRIPLLAGRDVAEWVPLPATPDSTGAANTPCEIVVNAARARRYLTGGGPLDRALGRRLLGAAASPCTVVGVAGDVRQASLAMPSLREIYYPYGMFDAHTQGADEMVFVVRSALPPAAAGVYAVLAYAVARRGRCGRSDAAGRALTRWHSDH